MNIYTLIGFISEWLGAVAVAWLLSLSPRFQKPVIGFRYARRDGFVALSLYALILVFAFVYYNFNLPLFSTPLRIAPAPINDLWQALLLAVLCLAAFLTALFTRKQPFRSAGWNQAVFTPALQMGFAIAVLTIFLHNRVLDVLAGVSSERLVLLPMAIGISLAEETIFRGYIQLRLASWLGPWIGLASTAVMFAVWHLPAWLHGLPVETVLILLGLTFGQGLILGWVMLKSGNVIAPALYRSFSIWMVFFV